MNRTAVITVIAVLFLFVGWGVFAFAHGPGGGGNGTYGAYGGWHCPWMGPGYVPQRNGGWGAWHCPWQNSGYAASRAGWYCPWMSPSGPHPKAPNDSRSPQTNQVPPSSVSPR